MSKLIAGAMAAAIAFTPALGGASRATDLRADVVYHILNAHEKAELCVVRAAELLDECDNEVDLALAFVETQEEFRLEDGTPVGQTSTSYAGSARVDDVQQNTAHEVGGLVATSVAAAVSWQAGWTVGTIVGQALVASTGGGIWWAAALGATAPWLGGAIAVAGAVY